MKIKMKLKPEHEQDQYRQIVAQRGYDKIHILVQSPDSLYPEHVVTACNCHDELVEACDKLLNLCYQWGPPTAREWKSVQMAEAALAHVEKGGGE